MDQSMECVTDFPQPALSAIKQFKASIGILTDGKKSRQVKAFWYLLPLKSFEAFSTHMFNQSVDWDHGWVIIYWHVHRGMETEWDNWLFARVTGNCYWPFFIFGHQLKYDTACAREALHLEKVKL